MSWSDVRRFAIIEVWGARRSRAAAGPGSGAPRASTTTNTTRAAPVASAARVLTRCGGSEDEPAARHRDDAGEDQRHGVDDLDQRVDRGAGGVLVGVADGVADHAGGVRLRALAAVVAVLDVLLGVVPGAAAVRS